MTVEKVYFTTKPFSDAEETLEVTHRYIAEALKDSDSLLYILLKEGKSLEFVLSMYLGIATTSTGLRLLKLIVDRAMEAIW